MTTDTTREREAFAAATQGVYSLRRRWDGTFASMLTENLWQGWLLRDAALAQRQSAPGQSELLKVFQKARDVINNLIETHPDKVLQANERPQLIGWFVGQMMLRLNGEASYAGCYFLAASALAHHGRSAGVEASEVERRARAAFELWREEITSSVAPPWDKQPEETRHRYRAEARATLATAPQPPAASSSHDAGERLREAERLNATATLHAAKHGARLIATPDTVERDR